MSEIIVKKCPTCNSNEFTQKKVGLYVCKSCGNEFLFNDSLSSEIKNLLNSADTFLKSNNFHQSKVFYKQVIDNHGYVIEAYWGLLMATYGIEYVYDKKTEKYIPTCHRCSTVSIKTDENYIKLMELLQGNEAQTSYIARLEEIDSIREKINTISKTEKDFDIFICFKATTEINGTVIPTADKEIGYKIFHDLTNRKYKVFFSPETLIAGEDYEPKIFHALETSKIMLLLATDKEYIDAPWVSNEWSRYLDLMANDSNKKLIPIFKQSEKMDIAHFPDELPQKQALELSDIDFKDKLYASIDDTMRKYLRTAKSTIAKKDIKVLAKTLNLDIEIPNVNIEKRKFEEKYSDIVIPASEENNFSVAYNFLKSGKFEKANAKFGVILGKNPNQHKAYWGKVLCEVKARDEQAVRTRGINLLNLENFNNALSYAPKEKAQEYLNIIIESLINNANTGKLHKNFNTLFNEVIKWTNNDENLDISKRLFSITTAKFRQIKFAETIFNYSNIVLSQNDANLYISKHIELANIYRNAGMFSIAEKYLNKIIEIHSTNPLANYEMFLCKLKVISDVNMLNGDNYALRIKSVAVIDEVEKLISYGYPAKDIIDKNILAAKYILIEKRNVKFSDALFEKCAELMPSIFTNEAYLAKLQNYADLLLLRSKFELAEKYYRQILSLDAKNYKAHWGLLKSANKCCCDYSLLLTKNEWADSNLFDNLLNSCTDEQDKELYLGLSTLQAKLSAEKHITEGGITLKRGDFKRQVKQIITNSVSLGEIPVIEGDIAPSIKKIEEGHKILLEKRANSTEIKKEIALKTLVILGFIAISPFLLIYAIYKAYKGSN